jgi:Flp pilus assembly pilin Flp
MRRIFLKRRDKRSATAIKYGLIVALIELSIIAGATTTVKTQLATTFTTVAGDIGATR